jgi:proline-specific peptidase
MTDTARREGFIPFRGYQTWYRVVGDGPGTRLLLLHGGPGLPSDNLAPLAELARYGRPVVFYDQLGCGCSERPTDDGLWSIALFVEEIEAVRAALGLGEVHLLGHSWGGMLALEYALTRPAGLRSLVLHSTFASAPRCWPERERVRDALPADIRDALRRHEAANTRDHPEYVAAQHAFDLRYTCRLDPWPEFLERAVAGANWHINGLFWAPGFLHPHGLLRQWDICDRLDAIGVPTLITSGRYDGWVPGQDAMLHAGIPGATWVEFAESAQYAHAEEPERYRELCRRFLVSVDSAGAQT